MIRLTGTALGAAFSALVALGPTAGQAAPLTFFGEDAGLGESTRLPSTPNATAARNNFLSNLTGVGTETFESFAPGSAPVLTTNFPGAGTATLTGADNNIQNVPTGTNGSGRYPTSGSQFLEASSAFVLSFNAPVAAFGFLATDIGDFNGQVTLTFLGGSSTTLNIGNTVSGRGGSVLFFGYIDAANPFTSVTFGNTATGSDIFGFDDFTIGSVGQVNPNPTPVPEPASFALLGAGLLGLGAARRRRAA